MLWYPSHFPARLLLACFVALHCLWGAFGLGRGVIPNKRKRVRACTGRLMYMVSRMRHLSPQLPKCREHLPVLIGEVLPRLGEHPPTGGVTDVPDMRFEFALAQHVYT